MILWNEEIIMQFNNSGKDPFSNVRWHPNQFGL